MKRTFIPNTNTVVDTIGSMNHINKKSFMATAIMNIPRNIEIHNNDIVYYLGLNGEQLSLNSELQNVVVMYNVSLDKKQNLIIELNKTQSEYQKDNNTIWDIQIDHISLLSNYMYASIRAARTFEGLLNSYTYDNSVEVYIKKYIKDNLLSKYTVSKVELFVEYTNLNTSGELRYNNSYDIDLDNPSVITCPINIKNNKLNFTFSQKENSKNFSFKYYYNISYSKI